MLHTFNIAQALIFVNCFNKILCTQAILEEGLRANIAQTFLCTRFIFALFTQGKAVKNPAYLLC